MTKNEDKANATADRARRFITETAMAMIPAKHLAIWAACRLKDEDLQPAEVWRVLIDAGMKYDHKTGGFAA